MSDVSWWRVPGQPLAALAWEKAHLPRAFTAEGLRTETGVPGMWSEQFDLPAVPGVLYARGLLVTAVAAGPGQSALRVDAEVAWLPSRPASERVPPEAKVVTITAVPGADAKAKPHAPVVISDPAKVRRLVSLVDGRTLVPPGLLHCPFDTGLALQLTFRKAASGPVLAVATAGLSGCAGVAFTVGEKIQPGLSGGYSMAAQVLATAGLRWNGY